MKKTIMLGLAALLVSAAVNAQTDTTKKRDTVTKKDSTQQQAVANRKGATTAQVNALNKLKGATSDMLLRKEEY